MPFTCADEFDKLPQASYNASGGPNHSFYDAGRWVVYFATPWGAAILRSVLVLSLALSVGAPPAATADELPASLSLAPAGADYYAAALRTGERWQKIRESNAWAKLNSLPIVRFLREQVRSEFEPSGSLSEYGQWLAAPEAQRLLALAADLLSQEIFVCTDDDFAEVLERWLLLQERETPIKLNFSQRATGPSAASSGQWTHTKTADWAQLAKHVDKLQVPGIMVGFKATDRAEVEAHLRRLEAWLRESLAEFLPVDRLKWVAVEGQRFLSLELDGSLVPWEQFEPAEEESNAEDREKAIAALKRKTLVLSLGLRGDYLIAAVGPSRKLLEQPGARGRLSERKELEPLRRAASQRLIDVEYRSQRLRRLMAGNRAASPDLLRANLSQLLSLGGIADDPGIVEKFNADLTRLAADAQADASDPGAIIYFSSLVEHGIESTTYDLGRSPREDGTRPLDLLTHVGSHPLFFAVGRRKSPQADYRRFADYVRAWLTFADALVLANLGDDQHAHYERWSQPFKQLLRDTHDITEKLLMPALSDGEVGWVVDGETKSDRWHGNMPKSESPMPMLLPALIVGVSNRAQLDQAMRKYWTAADGFLKTLDQLDPDLLPDGLAIPVAEMQQVAGGDLRYYALPKELGFDERIEPGMAVGERVLGLGLTRSQLQRLLPESGWRPEVGPLADWQGRPLYSATFLDCAGLMDAIRPWLEFAVMHFPEGLFDGIPGPFGPTLIGPGQLPNFDQSLTQPIVVPEKVEEEQTKQEETEDEQFEDGRVLVEQFRGFLEVLRVVRTVSIVRHDDHGALVTRRLIEIRDLPEVSADD